MAMTENNFFEDELNVEELEETKIPEIEQWKIDKAIKRVKDNNEEIARLKQILEDRKADLDAQFEKKVQPMLKENQFLTVTLTEYAKTQPLKETKTQRKYTSIEGEVVIKKPQKKMIKPNVKDEKTLEKIEQLYPEYVEEVKTKKLKWSDLKRKLVIQDDRVYDKETGEDVSHIVDFEVTEERTEIK